MYPAKIETVWRWDGSLPTPHKGIVLLSSVLDEWNILIPDPGYIGRTYALILVARLG
jgi:hypothetical protein